MVFAFLITSPTHQEQDKNAYSCHLNIVLEVLIKITSHEKEISIHIGK